jgi:hypothetical protein
VITRAASSTSGRARKQIPIIKSEYVTLGFAKGNCVAVNGKALNPLGVMRALNKLGGKHGVGRVDLVEIRKAVDFSTAARRQTVDRSGLPCEARFWDWKLGPAQAHYLSGDQHHPALLPRAGTLACSGLNSEAAKAQSNDAEAEADHLKALPVVSDWQGRRLRASRSVTKTACRTRYECRPKPR